MPADLVLLHHDQPMTTSLAIAEGVDLQHKNVIALVRKHTSNLQEFGEVAFETRLNPQGSPTDVVWLNEPQATLLLTFMRNSEVVIRFKVALVRAFFELRDAAAIAADPLPPSVSHRADHIVSATRCFSGFLRAAQAFKLPHARALRQANAATLRHTGVNIADELEAQDLLEDPPERARLADPFAGQVADWLASAAGDEFTSAEILAGLGRSGRSWESRLGLALHALGWRKRRRPGGRRGYFYTRPEAR